MFWSNFFLSALMMMMIACLTAWVLTPMKLWLRYSVALFRAHQNVEESTQDFQDINFIS